MVWLQLSHIVAIISCINKGIKSALLEMDSLMYLTMKVEANALKTPSRLLVNNLRVLQPLIC